MTAMYLTSYKYQNPSPAGPFKGRMPTAVEHKKGDEISAPFGLALVTSCRSRESRAAPISIPSQGTTP